MASTQANALNEAGSQGLVIFDGTATWTTANPYATGTFIPGFAFGGGTSGITYLGQSGVYTRIGNAVFFSILVQLTSKGTSTGGASVTGFPYTFGSSSPTNFFFTYLNNAVSFPTGTYNVVAEPVSSTTAFRLIGIGPATGGTPLVTDSNFGNNTDIYFTGCVFIF